MSDQTVRVGFATDVGRQRSRNEDSLALFVPYPGEPNPSGLGALLVVADGMGGEQGGEVASRLATDRLRSWFASGDYLGWTEAAEAAESTQLEGALRRAFLALGEKVRQAGEERPELRGLGSTLVAAAFSGDEVTIAHVGDSRCYRVRGGRIEQLTVDHSWVERQVRAGVLTAEQARSHPQRNILTRSLGDEKSPEPDLRRETTEAGDVFILCSDGLVGGVGDQDILAAALAEPTPQALAEALVRLANERDGSDNITVVVGKVGGVDDITRPNLESPPEITAPPRARLWLWLLAVLAGIVGGFAGGAWWSPRAPQLPPPGVEEQAQELLQQGERALAREQPLAAKESYEAALQLFRRAPGAVEAQRRLSELTRQMGGLPVEQVPGQEDPAPPSEEGTSAVEEPPAESSE